MFLVTQLPKKRRVLLRNRYPEYAIVKICVRNYPIRKKTYLQRCHWFQSYARHKLKIPYFHKIKGYNSVNDNVDEWKYPGAQVQTLNNISMKFQVCSANGFRDMRDTNFLVQIFTNQGP